MMYGKGSTNKTASTSATDLADTSERRQPIAEVVAAFCGCETALTQTPTKGVLDSQRPANRG